MASDADGTNFQGLSQTDVVWMLTHGALKPSDVPVEVYDLNGVRYIMNTRSASSLTKAGVPTSKWTIINKTKDM